MSQVSIAAKRLFDASRWWLPVGAASTHLVTLVEVLVVPEGPADPLDGGPGERRGAAERRKPDGGSEPRVAGLDQQLGDPHGREPHSWCVVLRFLYEAAELA